MAATSTTCAHLEQWWATVPAHQRRALERLAHHPLPHTLARALLQHPLGCSLLTVRGSGDSARYLLAPEVAEWVAQGARVATPA